MTLSLVPNAKQQFIDINGNPLVNGRVYMYIPSTLIAKNTWQDSGQSVLNTNPIVLDSRGQALIWGSGAYRQILKDADGNTIWDKVTIAPFGAGAGFYNLKDYGAVGDGATNDYAAFGLAYAAANAGGGGIVYAPPGTYAIASATSAAIPVPNNVTTIGAGSDVTIFKVTGSSTLNNPFSCLNPNNVWFKDLTIYGNSQSAVTASRVAGAIKFYMDNTASADCANFGTENVTFRNFKQPYWVLHMNSSAHTMRTIRHVNPRVYSYAGNMIDSTNINYPSDAFSFWGQLGDLAGYVKDVVISTAYGDGTYIKKFASIYDGTTDLIVGGDLYSFGANTSSNAGGYTLLSYHLDEFSLGTDFPKRIHIRDFNIYGAYSCGIYFAQVEDWFVGDGYIQGQTDTDVTLPKAGLSLNEGKNGVVSNLQIEDCLTGIWTTSGSLTSILFDNVNVLSSIPNAVGIRIGGIPSGAASTVTQINGCRVKMTGAGGTGILFASRSGPPAINPGILKISDCEIEAAGIGIQTFDATTLAGVVATGIYISDTTIGGSLSSSGVAITHTVTATPIYLTNVTVDGTGFASGSIGIALTSATGSYIDGLRLLNKTTGTGVMLSCENARGNMSGVQFVNVSAGNRYTTTTFGIVAPTWAGDIGRIVQNLGPAETGGGGSKYINQGWVNTDGSTTWLDMRTLTGN